MLYKYSLLRSGFPATHVVEAPPAASTLFCTNVPPKQHTLLLPVFSLVLSHQIVFQLITRKSLLCQEGSNIVIKIL